MPSDPWAARCDDLVKTYRTATGEVRALRGVSAGFPRGALTAVAGPSGSGKSSLLRLLAGMDRPTSGTLVVEGVRVHATGSRSLRRLRRRSVGYVFQRPSDNFFPHLTVGEHLRMASRGARPRRRDDLGDLLDVLGIGHRLSHRPAELSGGEQQRAAFAQALAPGASLVVADEPTAELDSVSADGVLRAIGALAERGVTFVLATHDPAVMRAAGEVLRLDHGVVASAPSSWRPAGRRPEPPLASDPTPRGSAGVDPAEPIAREHAERVVALEVRGITRFYRRGTEVVHAVREASFSVLEGELVGLLGRSGSGKTTLLNIVSGWERPDAGTVRRASGDDATPSWSELAVVPQKLGLIDELTIRENVEYPARLIGALEEVAWLVEELVDALGLRGFQHRYPRETSVGEQQRTALARALVLSPRLLLADEPSGHQDRDWTREVFDRLRRAVANGTACLTATHSEEIVRYLDRVLSMSDGELSERSA